MTPSLTAAAALPGGHAHVDHVVSSGLSLAGLEVRPAVVLAPMAGVTNRAFRTLCREESAAGLAEVATGNDGRCRPAGPVRLRDGDVARHRGTPGEVVGHAAVRPGGAGAVGAAVRRRSALSGRGDAHRLRRVRRRACRPELRLSGAEGHAQGRRRGPPGEAQPGGADPAADGGGGRSLRCAGDGEDQDRHRRRPPHPPRHRADRGGLRRGGDRAARTDGRAALFRDRPLGCDRRTRAGVDDSGPRERGHLGGRRRRPDGPGDRMRRCGRGPGLPRPALAVPRPGARTRRRGSCSRPACPGWSRSPP